MSKIEMPVGSRIEVNGITYEVRAADTCRNCSLYYEEENECLDPHGLFGYCGAEYRSDGKNVNFVQVTIK